MQTILELVSVPDHDFSIRSSQKLVPSVYLLINPKKTNESLQVGQILIFIRAQWHLGSSSAMHIADILSLVSNKRFDRILRYNNEIKLLWVLLVDDYLTIHTHAPGQSAYNPVERSMSSLSKKVAVITLLINHFENHLDSQGNKRDLIYEKPVLVEYVDEQNEKNSENDNKNNDIYLCYGLGLKVIAAALLSASNRFLSSLIKEKDSHYLNAIHTLEYFDSIKIPSYDAYLLSLSHMHGFMELDLFLEPHI
ncbi:9888_t:CDS:2 [Gigaspora margarita]|uniref:9888_t:CDS:1 n=1 Tax=Gigaspora margarita TaxID=4874 RepID=A0ABN7WG60_GIGMA|nr:9888_t:CDS:2 [Gigaspora margarita]